MTVAQRLYLLVSTAMLGLFAVAGVGTHQLERTYTAATYAAINTVPTYYQFFEINKQFSNLRERTLFHVIITDTAAMSVVEKSINESRTKLTEALKKYTTTACGGANCMSDDKEQKMFDNVQSALADYDVPRLKLFELSKANKTKEAEAVVRDLLIPAVNKLSDAIDIELEYNAELAKKGADDGAVAKNVAVTMSILITAVTLLTVGLMGFLIVRNLTHQLNEAVKVANRLANGDLTVQVDVTSKDEIGKLQLAMKNTVNKLREMMGSIRSSADSVSNTATQLSVGATQVAEGSRAQSEAASSMAASIEELTVSIDQVTDNAQSAKNASIHSGQISEHGVEVIQKAVAEMGEIETSVKVSSQTIESLEIQSNEISAVVNVIKEIADQTNLLALNAAIEAARAGEQGRGFAVVADEVRKLAERTGKSTQEITTMIANIQSGTKNAVLSMEQCVVRAGGGVGLASQAGDSITEIKTEAALVVQEIGSISDSLREQSMASRDIAKNVERIAQMAEENSAAVQQTADAAHHLEHMAVSLQTNVSYFKI